MKSEKEHKADLTQQAERGAQADALLNNALLKDAFEAMGEEINRAWRESAVHEVEVRENAHKMSMLLERLRSFLEVRARTGTAATKKLLELEKEKPDG